MRIQRWSLLLVIILITTVIFVAFGSAVATSDEITNETATVSLQDPDEVTVAGELQNESGEVQVFITFESPEANSVESLQSQANASQADFRRFAERTDGVTLDNAFWLTSAVTATVDTEEVAVDSLAAIEGVARIRPPVAVEIDSSVETQSASVPSQSVPPGTQQLTGTEIETTYGLEQIRAPEAWESYGTRGDGASVAVVDTGVDTSHPDLDICSTCWAEFDSSGTIVDSEPHDGHGHGTHVSGIVAGGNASGEHIGVAPDVELLHAKVLDGQGRGNIGQMIAGIEWAIEEDVDVLSLSLGIDSNPESFIRPLHNAEELGVTVVASVGNNGHGTSSSPGNHADSINVGATRSDGDVVSFSGGEEIEPEEMWTNPPEEWPETYVVPTVVAPGSLVLSANLDGEHVYRSGTSMAAPHVAGAVALAQAATEREHSTDELREAVTETARKPADWDEPDDEPDTRYGTGIIDVPAAISHLSPGESELAVTDATLSEETVLEGESVVTEATVENGGTSEGTFTVELTVDGTVAESELVFLEPDESETVTFEETFEETGEYEIAVSEEHAGTLTVEASELSVRDYTDSDGNVSTPNLLDAIADWQAGDIETTLLLEVITTWQES